MQAVIEIQNGQTRYQPVIADGITLEWERKGTPGKLTFEVVKDSIINFQEGNLVELFIDGKNMFRGFVFVKKRDKGETITVTAYDQLRYLKNKDTVSEYDITASQLLQNIAKDYNLQCGVIEETGLVLESILEDNQTLFDTIQNALDETLEQRKVMYVLYDEIGQLMLRNVESLKLDLLINANTAENFDYETSIDDQTYNKIKLIYDNDETGMREVYLSQDSGNQANWGVLQYLDTLQDPLNGPAKADALLSLYNQKTRKLSVSNALGDVRVRAGSAVAVQLNLGDIIASHYLMVDKVKHSFKENEHLMDLTLVGGEFIA